MFTTAEKRALSQLSTAGGRLAVVAADQRTKLVAMRRAAGMAFDEAALREFKLDLTRALAPHAPAILLDPEIGLPYVVDEGAVPPGTGLLVSLERSGAAELLPGVGALGVRRLGGTAAKLLVRLRADREDGDGPNAALVKTAAADCAGEHLLLVVEVLVEPFEDGEERRRADLVREGALLARECGARYLKLEYPGSEAACAAVTDALDVPWALLSAGVDHDTYTGQLRTALAGGAAGFIAGRSIWKDAVTMDAEARRSFLGGEARRRLEELLAVVA